jgi:hypothetical protein
MPYAETFDALQTVRYYATPKTTLLLDDPMSLTRSFYTKRKYELRVYVLPSRI